MDLLSKIIMKGLLMQNIDNKIIDITTQAMRSEVYRLCNEIAKHTDRQILYSNGDRMYELPTSINFDDPIIERMQRSHCLRDIPTKKNPKLNDKRKMQKQSRKRNRK